MPEITLTSFVDFVLANGTSRLTEIRRIKKRFDKGYGPASDFYKDLREAIQRFHKGDLDAPRNAVLLSGPRRYENFDECEKGHAFFVKSHKIVSSFDAPRTTWQAGDLTVVVNPE